MNAIEPAMLISDYLIWATTLIGCWWAGMALRDPVYRERWLMVIRRPAAMASLILLLLYLVIALIDSIHFRLPATQDQPVDTDLLKVASVTPPTSFHAEELSLLDLLLTPLRTRQERSYSAPLAIFAYSRERVETATGPQRLYPRLQYGGAHLTDVDQRSEDLLLKTLTGLGWGSALFTLLFLVPWLLWRQKTADPESQTAAWRTALLTVCTLCLVTGITTQLAGEYHLLGTDKVGQDVLYLGLKSIRTGILIGVLTLLVMLPLAIFMGVTAGYFGGRVDDLVQYLYTTLSSIPGVLLIAASVLTVNLYLDQNLVTTVTLQQRADLRLLMLTVILGLTGWIGLCRLLRGESLKLRELDYVTAAISMGVNNRLVLTRHLLPNLAHLVLITAVIDFSGLVLAEAVLSYVGVGVDPSMISWGNMINSARLEMAREPVVWWSLTTAFMFMFILVLAANLFADAVRDAFDPRLRGSF